MCCSCGTLGEFFCQRCNEQVSFQVQQRQLAGTRHQFFTRYIPVIQALFGAIKFNFSRQGLHTLAQRLTQTPYVLPTPYHCWVPVPSHPLRCYKRGGDVVTCLFDPFFKSHQLEKQALLKRKTYTSPLASKTRSERQQTVSDTIIYNTSIPKGPEQMPTVLLVDDIVTTGATMTACIAVLQQHGYHVDCMSIAYV